MKSQHLTQASKSRTGGNGPLATTAVLALAALLAMPGTASATHQTVTAATNWTQGPFYGEYGTFFADVDGDRKADAIAVNGDGRVWWRRSNGCSFDTRRLLTHTPFFSRRGTNFADKTGDNTLGPIGTETPIFGNRVPNRGTYFADVTGDEKADAIFNTSTGVIVRRSQDGRRIRWIDGPLNKNVTFANMDKDHTTGDHQAKADAVEMEPEGIMVRFSNGINRFTFPFSMTPPGHPVQYGTRGTYFADVDGDERADAIFVNEQEISVRTSSPIDNIFYDIESWAKGDVNGEIMNAFVDMTGDGLADAVIVNYDGLAVRESLRPLKRAFGDMRRWAMERVDGTRQTSFADVDGDGTADVIAVNDDGVWVRRSDFRGASGRC